MSSPHLHRRRARPAVVALGLSLALASCSILPTHEPVQVWQPPQTTPPATAAGPAPTGLPSLRVATPEVTGMLDNSGIVVMPAPGQVAVYQGARWSDPPALLVRERLVDAFMAAGVPSVTTDDSPLFARYTLSGRLRAFQSEYRGGTPMVMVRLDAQLRRSGSRVPLASHSFVITQDPAGTQVPQVVAAFGAADDALAHQVVEWVLAAAAHARPAPPESAPRN